MSRYVEVVSPDLPFAEHSRRRRNSLLVPYTPAVAVEAMLEARAVSVVYPGGVRALDRIDLTVAARETVALVGESGSGKSTLLRLFNRTVEPSEGEVRVDGEPVAGRDPVTLRRGIGFVPQEGGLIPHWTVRRNVELVPRLAGWERHRRERCADEVLALVGLEPATFAGRYPRELSGGQRQRVAIARALAADPPVVLLDEPFGALDALTRVALQDELAALQGRLGKTLLLVTHDLDEAFRLADRVAVHKDGRIRPAAPPAELAARPADGYVESLLSLRRGGGTR
jgi:osmoprotectant transport system ATP-binding protein